jgi:excisionase family DNA binding protein
MERLLTNVEVAAWLGVTKAWVDAHANGNRSPILPSVKIGKPRRFKESDVREFLTQCEIRSREALQGKAKGRRRAA